MPGKLGSLPESSNEFWQYAEKVPVENVVVSDSRSCEHNFKAVGNQVSCQNCYWGFYLTAETEVKEGHVYNTKSGKLIV